MRISCFAGGGAIEMELSKVLRDYSRTIAGKEQLIIGAIAKALEVIPRQLCDNAGFDATNILNKLRQKHAQGNPVKSKLYYSENKLGVIFFYAFKVDVLHNIIFIAVYFSFAVLSFLTNIIYPFT
jgi:chaperonin GroEL (HSP60 family)